MGRVIRNTSVLHLGPDSAQRRSDSVAVEEPLEIRIFGEDVPLRARVEIINGYSAHADRTEMTTWLGRVKEKSPRLGPIWLVHGEPVVQDEFRTALRAKGYAVECPEPRTRHVF